MRIHATAYPVGTEWYAYTSNVGEREVDVEGIGDTPATAVDDLKYRLVRLGVEMAHPIPVSVVYISPEVVQKIQEKSA